MPSLLTATGERIKLEPNRSYLMGRSAKCDLVVQDAASSRSHARLTVGGERRVVLMEDLGSRNGTFVNGRRIGGRVHLEGGSRIRIGATVYLLSLVDNVEECDAMIDSCTVGLEHLTYGRNPNAQILRALEKKGRAGTDFAGQLDAFSFIEVLQLLITTSRSGTLHIALENGHAEIEVRKGEVCSAVFEDLDGFRALVGLVRQEDGIFWLQESTDPCPNRLRQSGNRLLFELCRALDEDEVAPSDAGAGKPRGAC